jgi:hypothetical protein
VKVRIFLKNPLHPGRPKGGRAREIEVAATEVVGVAVHRDGGLDVHVEALVDERGNAHASPFPSMFLPMGKVDYYVPVSEGD